MKSEDAGECGREKGKLIRHHGMEAETKTGRHPSVKIENQRYNIAMSKKNELFVEQRPDRRYNVVKPNAQRPSAVTNTQKEAIERSKAMNPDAAIHVERVRNVGPGRDKWRRP